MTNHATLDFETRSEANLREVGAWRYAEDPTTEVICLCYELGDEVRTWAPGLPPPHDLFDAVQTGALLADAHNTQFERAIWKRVMTPVYGWPPIPLSAWDDTMAACGYKAVPLKLEKANRALGLSEQKDMGGNRLLTKLSSKDKDGEWKGTFEDNDRVLSYCAQDVRTEKALRAELGPLPAGERKVWLLDQKINERGVKIDRELCEAAVDIAGQVERRLNTELREITKGEVEVSSQRDRLLRWVKSKGVDLPDMTADTLDADWWRDGAPEDVQRALAIRRVLSKSSFTKYKAALNAECSDGRVRGMLQYHAAQTGRWGGRLVQPQNMRRPVVEDDTELLANLIKMRDSELIEALYGDAFEILADAVRGIFVADEGKELVVGDYTAVEAVLNACVAGETWKVEAFERINAGGTFEGSPDIYSATASKIFGYTVMGKKTHPDERQTGKTCELAFGYGGGVGAWRNFDDSDRHSDEQVDEFKRAWRDRHSAIQELWSDLETAAFQAVLYPGQTFYAADGRVAYGMEGKWLCCKLPSGRCIWYRDPHIRERPMPWSTPEEPDVRPQLFCWHFSEGQWRPTSLYGGALCSHVIQGLARDLLVWAMFRVERAGAPIVLTVHDELVAEVDEGSFSADELEAIMGEIPPWAKGWPIASECWQGFRYRK